MTYAAIEDYRRVANPRYMFKVGQELARKYVYYGQKTFIPKFEAAQNVVQPILDELKLAESRKNLNDVEYFGQQKGLKPIGAVGPNTFLAIQRQAFVELNQLHAHFIRSRFYRQMMIDVYPAVAAAVIKNVCSYNDVMNPERTHRENMANMSSHNAFWCDLFRKFLISRFCVENFYFFLEVDDYRQTPGFGYRALKVKRIYDRYISKSSQLQINIESSVTGEIIKHIEAGMPSTEIFSEAQGEVFRLISVDSQPSFVTSELFHNYEHLSGSEVIPIANHKPSIKFSSSVDKPPPPPYTEYIPPPPPPDEGAAPPPPPPSS